MYLGVLDHLFLVWLWLGWSGVVRSLAVRNVFTEGGIPFIIHQTWKDSDVPFALMQYQMTWTRLHQTPPWEYRLWTDADLFAFVRENCPHQVPTEYAHSIQFVDAARYCILYHVGGLFIDLDFEALRNIESLLLNETGGAGVASQLILTKEPASHATLFNTSFIVSNALMVAAPSHPLLLAVLDSLAPAQKWSTNTAQSDKGQVVMYTTGPLFLTHIVSLFACDPAFPRHAMTSLQPVCDRLDLPEGVVLLEDHILNPKALFPGDSGGLDHSFERRSEDRNRGPLPYAQHHWHGTWW